MRLAWKELTYNWKKYLLVEIIVILMMFMVLFLSGLVSGLGRAVSSGIESMDASTFVLGKDSEKLITVSSLTDAQYKNLQDEYGSRQTPLDIQRAYLQKASSDKKIDVTYFGIDPAGFLAPKTYAGTGLSAGKGEVILDDAFQDKGIKLGDTVKDSSSGMKLKVVGFTKDKMYGHVSVAYVSVDTFDAMGEKGNPMYQKAVHAVAISGRLAAHVKGTESYTKAQIVEALPGYKAEQMTITMVEWLLVAITAVIIGVFFFVINMQKKQEFGVMKAIGTSTAKISCTIVSQVFLIAALGAAIACGLATAMSAALPVSMPFYLVPAQVAVVLVAFVAISILSSLASVARVARIDPAKVIGGDFQ
ncbi:ABC transporter permease [Parafannyhessea umbonata]|uniref:ABC transporter permease n=1 Tax=Parafannyhessea umbonata TaxID=604330 RepID=UPI001569826C|nr:ABC transporter permease [Parafannyhessea umbonata]